jgi:hypothetical protein
MLKVHISVPILKFNSKSSTYVNEGYQKKICLAIAFNLNFQTQIHHVTTFQ